MVWESYDLGETIGKAGPDGGIVLMDIEHDLGARMTLEGDTDSTFFSINCGIYGWFFHTRFFQERAVADRACREMQSALDTILQAYPDKDDPAYDTKVVAFGEAISGFVDAYP